jgi:hypothetical protein
MCLTAGGMALVAILMFASGIQHARMEEQLSEVAAVG